MRSKASTVSPVIDRKTEGCLLKCSRRKIITASATARRALSCRTPHTPYHEEGLIAPITDCSPAASAARIGSSPALPDGSLLGWGVSHEATRPPELRAETSGVAPPGDRGSGLSRWDDPGLPP